MKFEPRSEEEIAAANLLEGGDYDFEVLEATEAESKAGNDMVKLKLGIHPDDGGQRIVFDYLVGTGGSMYKVHGFACAVGLLGKYENGEMLAEDMVGRAGKCTVGIDDKNKQYPAKNVVRAYLKPASDAAGAVVAAKANGRKQAPDLDDDIPF